MALFGMGKKKEDKKETPKAKPVSTKGETAASAPRVLGIKDVLLRPRITEKAANMSSDNVYVFDVRREATKPDVSAAIRALYKVAPIRINMVSTPPKKITMRSRRGFGKTSATKKAYVFLKKGDSISIS